MVFVIVVVEDRPGPIMRELDVNAVGHVLGSREEIAKVLGAQTEVSRLATETVYTRFCPGYPLASPGDNVTVGADAVHTATGFTVIFANAVDVLPDAETIASTAYVAATVPLGTDFVMTAEPERPGPTVSKLSDNPVGQKGCVEERLNPLGAQDEESLFVTVIV
jgi:hypothetical protein